MEQGRLDLVRRVFAGASTGELEPIRDLLDPEFELAPHITGNFEGVTFRGFAGLQEYTRFRADTWDSVEAEPSAMREQGDFIVVLGTLRMRGRGSGVEIEDPTVWVCEFRGGRLLRVEDRATRDPGAVAWALGEAGLPPDAFGAA